MNRAAAKIGTNTDYNAREPKKVTALQGSQRRERGRRLNEHGTDTREEASAP